ncbi:MAG: flagellar hook-associated protein FlgK [Planctomycetota bacterium]
MSGISYNIGLRALLASQSALETVGHNISNANTPGYSRQSLHLSAASPLNLRGLSIGNGVQPDIVLRTADGLLIRRIVAQTSSIHQLDTRLAGMSQVESIFGEPGERGLGKLMQSFATSLSSLASDPEDLVLRNGTVQSSLAMTARFNELASGLSNARRDNAGAVAAQVEQANTLAQQIAGMNREIATFEASGVPANDLRDKREQALTALGELIDIRYVERANGGVSVTTNGALLVGESKAYALDAELDGSGGVRVTVEGNPRPLAVKGGSIGGSIRMSEEFIPGMLAQLNELARNLIVELNRAHSTGVPPGGPFHALVGANRVADQDGDGNALDELLSDAGLPFDVQAGTLVVNVTDEATGRFTSTNVAIDPHTTTVADLLGQLNSIPHMRASLDSFGRVQVSSDDGFGFDFSPRLNGQPDVFGSFGGGAASLSTSAAGPFALDDGDTLDITGPGGAFSVTLDGADFADISQATAREVADALEADAGFASSGLRAVVVADRLVLQTVSTGASASFQLDGGSALGALGWSAGQSVSGQARAVDVTVSGVYTGAQNDDYTFVPTLDGTVGTTPGLLVQVFDRQGTQIATLDVGAGYVPGTELDVANGIQVSFGFGDLSATDGDVLGLQVLRDSDTSDVLVALGLNAFFTGSDAGEIALNAQIERDPGAIASSKTGAGGDNAGVLEMLAAQKADVAALDGITMDSYYGNLVSGIGFEIGSAQSARDVEGFLLDSLSSRREQVSGVNIDEELTNMIQFEQAFGAASRFITVINTTSQELLNLI